MFSLSNPRSPKTVEFPNLKALTESKNMSQSWSVSKSIVLLAFSEGAVTEENCQKTRTNDSNHRRNEIRVHAAPHKRDEPYNHKYPRSETVSLFPVVVRSQCPRKSEADNKVPFDLTEVVSQKDGQKAQPHRNGT